MRQTGQIKPIIFKFNKIFTVLAKNRTILFINRLDAGSKLGVSVTNGCKRNHHLTVLKPATRYALAAKEWLNG